MEECLLQTNLDGVVPLLHKGKVRDIYDLGKSLLMIATDRISAFDCILPNGIPGRGRILTEMSLFWFTHTRSLISNHVITTDVRAYPKYLQPFSNQLEGRSMIVRKAKRIDIECVARGYITGSGWSSYKKSGSVCGIALPPGLIECQRLSETIFTPATKAEEGHDENISFGQMCEAIGFEVAKRLRNITISLYNFARENAEKRGIIIADTKFEFGIWDGTIILIDEMLSPDSSRFWDAATYEPGRSQESFDKQYVRDWLDATGWNHQPPAPSLPKEVVEQTLEKYEEARRRLLG